MITQENTVKCAPYTYTQIHALEPNPLNLLVNTVKADEKRPVQDNDLHVNPSLLLPQTLSHKSVYAF